MASNRDTILDALKSCLENITTDNGFNYTVSKIERKFLYYDNIFNFPFISVLGGPEEFEDELNDYTISRMTVRIVGYNKDIDNPEQAQCDLLEDVLKCLDNDTYNTIKSKMRPTGIDTDEGALHEEGAGISLFVLSLEIVYRFKRNAP
jgi:hypothetical protein